MTRKIHDQFSKSLLNGLLSPGGTVQSSYSLSSEVKEIDILFQPDPIAISALQSLGLLARMATRFCLIEPYRNPVALAEIEACLSRALEVRQLQRREAKRDRVPAKQVILPHLWILSPTVSKATLESFQARQQEDWGQGIYFLAPALRTAIVVLHQLPPTLDTMWLRLMGRGTVQAQAISELLALSTSDAFRKVTLHHLAQLRLIMKTRQKKLSKNDQELVDNLNSVYEVWERETIEKGRQEGLEQAFLLTIPALIEAGFTPAQIAQRLQTDISTVDRVLDQQRTQN